MCCTPKTQGWALPIQRVEEMMRRSIFVLAIACSVVAVGLSAAGAWQRAGLPLERALFGAVAVLLTVAVHVLPALVHGERRAVRFATLVLWLACLVAVVCGHLAFFAAAARHAGELRAEAVAGSPGLNAADRTVRPLAAVAADLARVTADAARLQVGLARCRDCPSLEAKLTGLTAQAKALQVEQAEAQRRISREDAMEAKRQTAAVDPVAGWLAVLTGVPDTTVALSMAVLTAVVLELVATLLWCRYRAVTTSSNAPVTVPDASVVPVPETPDTPQAQEPDALADAVRRGELRPTVAAIRKFLGCSQTRATEVRRRLLAELAGTAGGAEPNWTRGRE